MKKFFVPIILVMVFMIACSPDTPPQPKTNYDIYSGSITGATKYHFFLEKKSATAYHLVQGADYLSPTLAAYKVGEASTPTFMVNLTNDGSEYTVGVVAENSAGFYSGLGVATGTVGLVPTTPAGVGLRKH
jgi:hypothetical protein